MKKKTNQSTMNKIVSGLIGGTILFLILNFIVKPLIEEKKVNNYNSIVGYFKVTDKYGKVIQLEPEVRVYNQPIIITSEADIKTTLFEDKFLVMNLVKGDEYFNIRYQVKPFMLWIWISVSLISLGGLMSLLKKEYAK